jgi:hypothetical protein
MKNLTALLLSSALCSSLAGPSALAQEAASTDIRKGVFEGPEMVGSLSTGYESLHIFRGVDSAMDGDIFWASTSLSIADALSGGFWYGTGIDTEYEEFTPYVNYVLPFEQIDLTVGVVYYTFPDNDDANSADFSLRLSKALNLAGPWEVTPYGLAVYNESAEGFYFEGGLTATTSIVENVDFSATAWVAASTSYRPIEDGLDNATLLLSLPVQITGNATLTPFLGGSLALDAIEDISEDEFWAGATLDVSF